MKDSIKLIAVDMDGTLLRSDKTVDPQTITDINAALEKGIDVAYCTGRGIAEMIDFFHSLPMIRYAVCSSGAVVYDVWEDRILYKNGVPQPYIRQIVELAEKYKAMPHFLTDRESIVNASDVDHMEDFHMGVYKSMFQEISRQVDDMEEESLSHSSVGKINIYFRTVEDREEACGSLKDLPVDLSLSENTTLEMTAPNTNKGTGLEKLAEYLDIPRSQTAGVGDNYNDTELMKAAGFSVAMGNAIREIKDLSDHVTADNDHNGVGQVIRFILEKNL